MDILFLLLAITFLWKIKFKKELNEEYLSFRTCCDWKGFLALTVVFHHLAQRTADGVFFRTFTQVGFLVVSVFFFFSGYGLQKKYISDNSYKNNYLKKRIPAVLFPYIIITIVYWLAYALCGEIYSIKDIFLTITNGRPFVLYSWYVINIILFYLAFYILMKVCKRNYNYMIIGAAILYVLWVYICRLLSFGQWWYCSSQLLVVGIIWATYEQKIIKLIKARYYTFALAMTTAFFACFLLQYKINIFHAGTIMKLLSSILFTMVVLLFSMRFQIGNRILSFFGKISFEIYLSHGLFIMLYRNNILNIENDLIWSVLVLISATIFSFIFYKICKFTLFHYHKFTA